MNNNRPMFVFDFDDTLVRSPSRVVLIKPNGEIIKLETSQYAAYVPQRGDRFDFSEFDRLPRPKILKNNMNLLLKYYHKYGKDCVAILSARGDAAPIRRVTEKMGLKGIEIVAVGSSNPTAKSSQIARWIEDKGLTSLDFYDDSEKNIDAVNKIIDNFPDVMITTHHVID